MGKKAKEHRKKVAKRNEAIKESQKNADKVRNELLNKLIERERQKGLFESPVMSIPTIEGPSLDLPSGPQI